MKPLTIILISMIFLISKANAQTDACPLTKDEQPASAQKEKLNFFAIAKRKKGKLDLATRFNVFRTKLRALSHKHTFISIIAKDGQDMARQISEKLNKVDATIGTLWFDSHGSYKKGYSLFYIGHDEYSMHTLKDDCYKSSIENVARFTDADTKIIIGSCYGGATYVRSTVDYKDTLRMDGDTLMMTLGNIFRRGQVFASESWVMSKPGLFHRRPAVGGNPGRKLFLDICYRPAWDNIGVWNKYNVCTRVFEKSNPISMDPQGNLVVRGRSYAEEKNIWKDREKKLKKMAPGLFK